MSFESFYGGRQGASFVIVHQFDAIDITKTPIACKGTYLAVSPDPVDAQGRRIFLYNTERKADQNHTHGEHNHVKVGIEGFIERDGDNYPDYAWEYVILDGSTVPIQYVNSTTETDTEKPLPIIDSEGMVQCFSQGGDTTDIVNYGEYVIIDTPHKDDPDNGKVYRRGLFYKDALAGAEYIGQIVGPQGNAPTLGLDTEREIKNHDGYKSGEYTVANEALIPGKTSAGDFNDKITYSWVNIRDEYGHVLGALIGFTTPYLVVDYTAEGVDAYYNKDAEGHLDPNKELITRIDDETHPFYEKWQLKVPQGIKGNSIENLEIYYMQVIPGVEYFEDPEFSIFGGNTDDYTNIDLENFDPQSNYVPIIIGGTTYYVVNEGDIFATERLRYTEKDYYKNANGDAEYKDVGPYNMIKSLFLENNQTLWANYTHDNIQEIGEIQLERATLSILTYLPQTRYLHDDTNPGTEIPPEYMAYAMEVRGPYIPEESRYTNNYIFDPTVGKNRDHEGYLVGITNEGSSAAEIYAYDYVADEWRRLGSIDSSLADPTSFFQWVPEGVNPDNNLKDNGFGVVYKIRKCV